VEGVEPSAQAENEAAGASQAAMTMGTTHTQENWAEARVALGDVLTETQPTDPIIVRYWSSPNALRVVVRMLPPLAIEMASLANSSSFGASMMTTMS